MIEKLTITNTSKLPTPWWSTVKQLKKIKDIEFKPGMNIIVGKNATGKSTIITLLARHFHCEQGGISLITEPSLSTLFTHLHDDDPYPDGYKVRHDGQPVGFFSPDKIVGHKGYLDYDFIAEDLSNRQMRASQGQVTMVNVIRTIQTLHKTDRIEGTMSPDSVNDLWARRIKIVRKLLKGTMPKGPKTLILDEPERSLDLENEIEFFNQAKQAKLQIIMASHSVFAFMMKDANIIELNRGYAKNMKEKMDELL